MLYLRVIEGAAGESERADSLGYNPVLYNPGAGSPGQWNYIAPGYYTQGSGAPLKIGPAPPGGSSSSPSNPSQPGIPSVNPNAPNWLDLLNSGALPGSIGTITPPLPGQTAMSASDGPGSAGAFAHGRSQSVLDSLLSAASINTPLLMSPNLLQTNTGQAIFNSLASGIHNSFNQARQRLEEQMGPQQGNSGILQGELANLDQQEAEQLSNVQRQFLGQELQNQQTAMANLTGLVGLQNQQQAQALAIAQGLDQQQRQEAMDLYTLATGQQPINQAGDLSSALLNYAGQQGAYAQNAMARNAQGFSGLGQALALAGGQPSTPYGGGSSYYNPYGNVNTSYTTDYMNQGGSPFAPNPYNTSNVTRGFGSF